MTDITENIPTLTDIVQAGDESMLNHFDAHQLHNAQDNSDEDLHQQSREDATEYNMQNLIDEPDTFDNTNMFENTVAEPQEIPSITLADEQEEDITNEDFSDAMQLIIGARANSESETLMPKTNSYDNDILKEKINQAIQQVLPAIEEQLKEQLYKQFEL